LTFLEEIDWIRHPISCEVDIDHKNNTVLITGEEDYLELKTTNISEWYILEKAQL